MIVYNYDADLEVSVTCVRSSLLSWVKYLFIYRVGVARSLFAWQQCVNTERESYIIRKLLVDDRYVQRIILGIKLATFLSCYVHLLFILRRVSRHRITTPHAMFNHTAAPLVGLLSALTPHFHSMELGTFKRHLKTHLFNKFWSVKLSHRPLSEEMHGAWSRGPKTKRKTKETWREVVKKDCQARKLNKEDAMDCSKWRQLIKMSDNQDGCEWVFLLVLAYPGSPGPKAGKRLCVCMYLWAK